MCEEWVRCRVLAWCAWGLRFDAQHNQEKEEEEEEMKGEEKGKGEETEEGEGKLGLI